ncbi:hypothetical protein PIB30_105665 [Stylosanthes scabra]|uniref:Uncharacterized protein n=1 Tax=Stylosanthes scabra TaxID=79078 RepID=A0ABU6R1A9_9FABA|nr:hypothetical protein [Stylosanthes scabra]
MDETRANFRNQEAAIRNLEIQVGQIAKQLNEKPPNTLPGDTIPNPREECKAIRVIEMEETPEVQVEVPTEKLEITAEIEKMSSIHHNLRKNTQAVSPIPTEEEKKKKEPAAYMPKPPYPQRLKAENKNEALKKEPKEEKHAANDSVKFHQIQKVPTMPYLLTIMGSNNKTYIITEGVCNKFFEPP